MSASQLSAFLPFRQFDNASKELAAGFVYFYDSGTSTLSSGIYADSTGTTTVNPVQLDGAGLGTIYGVSQAYKVTITDVDGNQIWEQDPVFPFGADSGSSLSSSFAFAENYSELRNLTQDYLAIVVCGRSTSADGGEGIFYRTTETLADNDGTILKRGSSTSYVRGYEGLIDPRWFGVAYGATSDQLDALNAATAVGPVQITGEICQVTDRKISGVYSFLPGGGFNSSGTPKLTFLQGSKIIQGASGIFGSGINVVFEQGVCDSIHSSWFSSFVQSLCTPYAYNYLVDADTELSGTVEIPNNYAVDFLSGSEFTVSTTLANIAIKNLVYSGASRIIKYAYRSYIGAVDLGDTYARLEWFGGQSGSTWGIDNRIAMKASAFHGKIKLLNSFYRIIADTVAWSTEKPLEIVGSGVEEIETAQTINCTAYTHTKCAVTGSGAITATGNGDLDHASILGVQERTSASTTDATSAAYLPGAYMAAGSSGLMGKSTDFSTWSLSTGTITDTIRALVRGPVWVAVGQSGRIWKSTDGGGSWASQTIASAEIYGGAYLNGNYVLVGASGAILVSTDAITWNSHAASPSATLRAICYHATTSLYVTVGNSAYIATSLDLITWTTRPVSTEITGNILAVVAGPGGSLVASGALSGVYLLSSTAISWQGYILPSNDTIYAASTSADTIVLAGSSGALFTSTTNGITFLRVPMASTSILSSAYSQGAWMFGSTSGYVWMSSDLKTFSSQYVGAAADVDAVSILSPVYAVSGLSGALQTSLDGEHDWTEVTVGSFSGNWRRIRILADGAYLMGDSGNLWYTIDFVSFRKIPIATTNGLYDICYNSAAALWVVTGAAGYIASTANIASAAPTWTARTVASSESIIRAVWDGTRYTFASTSQIWQTTDIGSPATQSNSKLLRGMIINGATRVQYGDSGRVVYSTDSGETWTSILPWTSYDFTCGYFGNGSYFLGTSAGTIYYCTDGIGWVLASATGLSGSVTAFHYNPTENSFGVVTGSHNMYKSPTGAVWSNGIGTVKDWHNDDVTLTFNFYDIWDISGEWQVCGSTGFWMYCASGATAWYRATSAAHEYVAQDYRAGYDNFAIGALGTVAAISNHTLAYDSLAGTDSATMIDYEPISSTQGMAIDDTGKAWLIDVSVIMFVTASATTLTASTAKTLVYDSANTTIYAVGSSSVWTTTKALGFFRWSKKYILPTEILDLDYSGSVLRVSGLGGLYATSSNGLIWAFAGDEFRTPSIPSIDYWNYGQLSLDYSILAFAQGGNIIILAGSSGSLYSGTSAFAPVITASKFTIASSTVNVDLVSFEGGTISGPSTLRSITFAGLASDTTFTRMSGEFDGDVARCTVTSDSSFKLTNAVIETSTLTKTDFLDPYKLPTIVATGTCKLEAVTFVTNGPLCASDDTSAVVMCNGCDFTNGSSDSNGVAELYINGSPILRQTSAYSIDGITQDMFPLNTTDDSTLVASSTVATDGSYWGWLQIPTGSTSDGTTITTGTDQFLGAYNSVNALHFKWKPSETYQQYNQLPFLCEYGGQIIAEITYPSAPDPRSRLVMGLFESITNGTPTVLSSICSSSTIPGSSRMVKLTANAWGGIEGSLGTGRGVIVIYDAVGGVMPVGTKIKLTSFAGVPKNRQIYDKFWPNFEDYTETKNSGYPSYITYSLHDVSYLTCDFEYGLTCARAAPDFNPYNFIMHTRRVDQSQG